MPKEDRDAVEQEHEIFGFLTQSHISPRNVSRLRTLASSRNARISELAGIVMEVAQVTPHKRRRLQVLPGKREDLLAKLHETDLILAHHS